MSSVQIKALMETKRIEVRAAFVELGKQHVIEVDKISKAYAEEITQLSVSLRRAELQEAFDAEEAAQEEAEGWNVRKQEWITYKAAREAAEEDEEGWNVGLAARQKAAWLPPQGCDEERERSPSPVVQDELCYHCGSEELGCRCGEEFLREARENLEAEDQEEPCYHCGHAIDSCLCAEEPAFQSQLNAEAKTFVAQQEEQREGTKLKWISSTNPETYSVAIVKKNGILEVKRVTDGAGYCHNPASCDCSICRDICLSRGRAPIQRVPLVKTFFETEAAWRASLPGGGARGSITTTVPAISHQKLKALSLKPLSGTTDALKLKELQKRFTGGTIVLNTDKEILEIEHVYYDIAAYPEDWCHQIYSKNHERSVFHFLDLGASPRQNGKPQIMAEWNGLYIDVSHLF